MEFNNIVYDIKHPNLVRIWDDKLQERIFVDLPENKRVCFDFKYKTEEYIDESAIDSKIMCWVVGYGMTMCLFLTPMCLTLGLLVKHGIMYALLVFAFAVIIEKLCTKNIRKKCQNSRFYKKHRTVRDLEKEEKEIICFLDNYK